MRKSCFGGIPDRCRIVTPTHVGNTWPLIWIKAHRSKRAHKFGVAQGEVASGRAALTEPLWLLGTRTIPVSAASALPRKFMLIELGL